MSGSKKNYSVIFALKSRDDYQYFEKNNPKVLVRIAKLIEAIIENQYAGIGKPKQLGHDYSGAWSRRIDNKHRIVYTVFEKQIYILSLRGHYADK